MLSRTLIFALCLLTSIAFSQEIALTFDDAPTPDGPAFPGVQRTEKILQQLHDHHVTGAGFFVVTSGLHDTGLSRIRAYTDAGHVIANHTHLHRSIRDLGLKKYLDQIRVADSVLRKMPGFMPWFRYPFLDEGRTKNDRDSIRNYLNTLGLSNGYVTIDNYDWYINELYRKAVTEGKQVQIEKLKKFWLDHIWQSIQFYDAIAQNILKRSPKHVLLLHENDLTAMFLGDLIAHLRSKGWKIISPAEAYNDPIAKSVPDVLFNGQGRVGAIAYEAGMKPKDLVQESEDELFLQNLAAQQSLFE